MLAYTPAGCDHSWSEAHCGSIHQIDGIYPCPEEGIKYFIIYRQLSNDLSPI